MDRKVPIKSLAVFVLPYWIVLTFMFSILTFSNESMMLIALFAIVIGRLLLWASPFYLTIVSWILCYRKTKRIGVCVVANIVLLAIDFAFYFWTYTLTGGWY